MRAREHDLHLVPGVTHVEQQAAHAVARLELLARDLLRARHESLGSVDLHDERIALVALRKPGHELAAPLGVLVEQRVALVLAVALDHHLLGGLRRDSAELLRIVDLLAHAVLVVAPQRDLARDPVNGASELLEVEGVEVLAGRAHHGLLEVLEHQLAVHALLACHGVHQSDDVVVHCVQFLGLS